MLNSTQAFLEPLEQWVKAIRQDDFEMARRCVERLLHGTSTDVPVRASDNGRMMATGSNSSVGSRSGSVRTTSACGVCSA